VKRKELDPGNAFGSTGISQLADGLDEASAGRQLFALAAACRLAGIDPESALRREASRVAAAIAAGHVAN
jgi:XTP/dITP diphosphohydrolase/tetrapyrrole methylase family protein/MazG family protein